MPGRSRYFTHSIGDAFPSANPLSRVMWSLMAIHADLRMEWTGIGVEASGRRTGQQPNESVTPQEFFQRMYFFRGSLRSLSSGCTQLRALSNVSREFQELATRSGRWDDFREQRAAVYRHEREFDRLRNTFGAHTEESVADSLNSAPRDELVCAGFSADGHIGCEWGAQAYLAALNQQTLGEEAEQVLRRMAAAGVDFIKCFNTALHVYASRYPVFERP